MLPISSAMWDREFGMVVNYHMPDLMVHPDLVGKRVKGPQQSSVIRLSLIMMQQRELYQPRTFRIGVDGELSPILEARALEAWVIFNWPQYFSKRGE